MPEVGVFQAHLPECVGGLLAEGDDLGGVGGTVGGVCFLIESHIFLRPHRVAVIKIPKRWCLDARDHV